MRNPRYWSGFLCNVVRKPGRVGLRAQSAGASSGGRRIVTGSKSAPRLPDVRRPPTDPSPLAPPSAGESRSRAPKMVGRDREFAHAVRVLTASRSSGVVLVGVAGVGRTRLADEVLSHFRACGWLTLRVPGMQAMSRTSPTWLLDDVSRIRTADEPLLIVLDDAHLLDPASAAQLHVLVADAQVSVLAT